MTQFKWPEGEEFVLDITTSTQVRIDSDKVRAKFVDDPDALKELVKEIPVRTIKTVRRDPQKKPKRTVPNLQNATPEFLIDELGKLREQKKELEFTEGIYKEALEARINKLRAETNNK